MAEYALDDIFEEVILNIEDYRFALKERTHSLGAKAETIQERINELPDDSSDEPLAEMLIDLIDLLLEPQGNGNGTRKHAKTILSPAYKNEKVGLDKLLALTHFLQEKLENRSRPTSPPASVG